MFKSILTGTTGTLSISEAMICVAGAIVLGLIIAVTYMLTERAGKSFLISLCILPVTVQAVIMMVNGNLGTGIAVLGAFSLIRFRSVPGNAKEICAIFLAMAVGLATGMGYITFGAVLTVIVCLLLLLLSKLNLPRSSSFERTLKITIPEDLEYTEVFDDIFGEFARSVSLDRVKTTNLGSMFELQYTLSLRDERREKEMIDRIRTRNGNLPVICGRYQSVTEL